MTLSSLKATIRPWLPQPVRRLWHGWLELRNKARKLRDGTYVLPFCKIKTSGLIFDIGVGNGDDTAFYLAKGFRVVAVEANPVLVAAAKRRFDEDIQAGRLAIVEKAIATKPGRTSFDIHRSKPALVLTRP